MQGEFYQKDGAAIQGRWNHGGHIARSAVPGEVVIVELGSGGHGEFRNSPHTLSDPCSREKNFGSATTVGECTFKGVQFNCIR